MKWVLLLSSFTLFMILLAGSITYVLLSGDEEEMFKNEDEADILFFESYGTRLYVEEETLDYLNDPENFDHTKRSLIFNDTFDLEEANRTASTYLDEPVFDPRGSSCLSLFYEDNSSRKTLRIGKDRGIALQYHRGDPLSPERIPDEELLNISVGEILRYRGNIEDLKLDHISGSKAGMGNSETGEKTFLGYGSYIVEFRQFVDGVMISGTRGEVMICINSQGHVMDYFDRTVEIKEITDDRIPVEDLKDVLIEYCKEQGKGKDFTLDHARLVFYTHGSSNRSYMQYELKLTSRSRYCSCEIVHMDV